MDPALPGRPSVGKPPPDRLNGSGAFVVSIPGIHRRERPDRDGPDAGDRMSDRLALPVPDV
jgi:hypothetical protein